MDLILEVFSNINDSVIPWRGEQKGHHCPSEGRAFTPAGGVTLPLHKHAEIIALVAFLANIFTVKLIWLEYLWGVNTMEHTNTTNTWVADVLLQPQPLPGDCSGASRVHRSPRPSSTAVIVLERCVPEPWDGAEGGWDAVEATSRSARLKACRSPEQSIAGAP